MTHPRDYLPLLDHIEAALEATCAAVMSLESIDILAATADVENVQGHVATAILSLRHAIGELRDAQQRGASGLALGFVLARERRAPGDGIPGQSRPRRTA
jgi:hypothetical protein